LELAELLLLAVVQALTEFLPVSSSGHLALAGVFLGFAYQGLFVDLMLHAGTLLAVLVYYRRDFAGFAASALAWRPGRAPDERLRLLLLILLATLPGGVLGLLLLQVAEDLRHPLFIASNLAGFGLLLWLADRRGGSRRLEALSWRQALAVGAAQALALFPGVSRSGICLTAALWLGFSRAEGARLAFLLAAPITAAACLGGLVEAWRSPPEVRPLPLVLGVLVAAGVGLVAIRVLIGVLERFGALPFAAYRLALALAVVLLHVAGGRG
jgi:undecaprenyl-diphosphatase